MFNGAPITESVIGSVIGFQAFYKSVIGMMAMLFNKLLEEGFSPALLFKMQRDVFMRAVAIMQRISFEGVSGTETVVHVCPRWGTLPRRD